MLGDLARIEDVKDYLALDDYESDALLARLISQASFWLKTQTRRDFVTQRYVETRNGTGQRSISPWQYPIVSVQSVTVDDVAVPMWVPPAVPGSLSDPGWTLSEDAVWMINYNGMYEPFAGDYGPYFLADPLSPRFMFTKGFGNVTLAYTAGYAVQGEAATVPAGLSIQAGQFFTGDLGVSYAAAASPIAQTLDPQAVPSSARIQAPPGFVTDLGVSYESGTALTPVPQNPLPGQYTVSPSGLYGFSAQDVGATVAIGLWAPPGAMAPVASSPGPGQYTVSPSGLYTFAAADHGAALVLSYGTVPADVQQAVIDKAAWDFKARDRVGQRSKSVGNETITFMVDACSASTQAVVDAYARRNIG